MNVLQSLLAEAWRTLRFHVRRSVLTMLGIAWGIATVVILLAYGTGFERAVFQAFEVFGTKTIVIFPGRTSQQAGGEKAGKPIRLQLEDMEFIQDTVPLVKNISPELRGQFRVAYGTRAQEFSVTGVYPVYDRIRRMDLAEGRWLGAADQVGHARVAVIGAEVKKRLLSERPALGEEVRVGGISFQLIGVLERKVQDSDEPDNLRIFVPFSSMGLLRNTRYLSSIILDAESTAVHEKVTQQIRERLGERLGFRPTDRRAVFVWDVMNTLEEIGIITGALKVMLAFIGALTLAIGGVGVMNIMLVSVMQRTREIGTRKSLGAKRRHILTQFLAEALLLTMIGGLIGVGLAYSVTWILGPLPLWSAIYGEEARDADIFLRISWQTLLVASGILSAVGLAAGLWPAVRASRMDPVEALRYE